MFRVYKSLPFFTSSNFNLLLPQMNTTVTEQPYVEAVEEITAQSKKGLLVLSAVIFTACLLAGCAHFFYHHRYMPLAQLSSFLLLGCFYAVFMQKKRSFSHALFLTVALFVSLSAFYFFKKAFEVVDIISLVSSFLLPNIIMEAWRLFHSISSQRKNYWSYSTEIPSEPLFVYLENKPLRVKLLVDNNDSWMILSAAPLTLPLGMAIFYILKKEVEFNSGDWHKLFIDENGMPYKWLFYKKQGLEKIYFKPEETLIENKIKSNTLIVAKRIE